MPRAAAVALCLAGALTAGCGGPSTDEFAAEADGNCRERQRTEIADKDRTDQRPGAWVDVYVREGRAQREVEAPDDLRAGWRRYLGHMDAFVAASQEIYRRDEPLEFNERSVAQGRAARAGVQARRQARALGLEVCARQIY
jgi:hypothetical protein